MHVRLCCAASRTGVSQYTVRFTSTRPLTRPSALAYNAVADLLVRTGLQRRDRLARVRAVFNTTADSFIRAGLQCRGRISRRHRLTNVAADSPIRTGLPRRGRFTRERLQLHLAIINFMADYFRPGTSGDIHLKYILLVHIIFCQRAVYLCLGLQYC